MADITGFTDDAARALRQAEVPLASFGNGCNIAGSNACGLGINIDGGEVVGTAEQFTLLDQRGIARVTQISQCVGGFPYVPNVDYPSSGGSEGTLPDAIIFTGTNSLNGDGEPTRTGDASLVTLGEGWVVAPI